MSQKFEIQPFSCETWLERYLTKRWEEVIALETTVCLILWCNIRWKSKSDKGLNYTTGRNKKDNMSNPNQNRIEGCGDS